MSLPMSFCTNSMALSLAYQVNGSNKFIIVFLVSVLVVMSIHSSDKKMPLHVKKNTGVKFWRFHQDKLNNFDCLMA